MTLAANVLARYSNQRMVSLTNPDVTQGGTALTVDTDRLDAAVDDVIGDFVTWGGLEYDDDDRQHVAVACQGVIAYLLERGTQGGAKQLKQFHDALTKLTETTSNDRVDPSTNGNIVVTPEGTGGRPARPAFDQKAFGGVLPNQPHLPGGTYPTGGNDDDEDDD